MAVENKPEYDEDTAQFIKQLMQLSMDELFEVKIKVASKTLESVFDAPSSVTVFTHQELLAMGLTSVEDLLNFVPGFFVSSEIVFGSGYMVAARGRTSPQASYNVLFMLDGERLNNETSGGALSINRYIPLYNVKQVEIIRGPGSALYGTSAFLGVVNIVTHESDNRAFVSAGSFAYHEAAVQAHEQGKNWSASAFARYFKDNGADYPTLLAGTDPRQGTDISLGLLYQNLSFKLRHTQRQVSRPNLLPATAEIPNFAKSEQTNLHFEYKQAKNLIYDWTLRVGYMQETGDTVNIDNVAQNFLRDALYSPTHSAEQLAQVPLLSGTLEKEYSWHLSWDGHYLFNPKHEMFAGVTWRSSTNAKSSNQNNFDYDAGLQLIYGRENIPIAYYENLVEQGINIPEVKRDVLGVYLQSKHIVTEQLSTTLGTRYDEYSDFGSSINPRVAFLYSPKPSTQLKFMYGQAFRAPSLRQFSGILTGNSTLASEKIKTAELAWLQAYPYKKLQTTLTYFQNWHSDLIDTVATSNQLIRQFVNLPGTIKTSGWELEASIKPIKPLSVRLAYSYLNETEEHPQRYPHNHFSLILNYQMQRWNINLRTQFHDAVEYDFNRVTRIELDSYWRMDATLRYQLEKNINLVGRVNNLLDEDYYSSSKEFNLPLGLPNRGRSANLGIEMSW